MESKDRQTDESTISTNKTLIGACGIFCRACDHYFANTEDGAHLLHDNKIQKRVSAHPCQGCKAKDEDKICVYCVGCDVRLCSLEHNVELCSECGRYPCDKLERFHTGLPHHKEAGKTLAQSKGSTPEQWYALSEKRWSCPSCGHRYSYYEKNCVQCKAPLDGLAPDIR